MLYKISYLILLFSIVLVAQQIPPLPYPIGAGSAEVYNNNIYTFGGSINWSGSTKLYDSVFVYNGSAWSFADTIPDNNLWDVETVRIGNEVFLIAGWSGGQNSLRKFNLDTYEWEYLASNTNSYDWGITAEYVNGDIYLFNPNGDVFEYSIADNEWNNKTNAGLVGPSNLSSIVFQDEIYIIGFYDSSFVKYNPAADQWTALAKSPYQVGASAMGIINDNIYNIGGSANSSSAEYKSVIVYDISHNEWSLDNLKLSSKRHWMSTAEYRGGLYVLGGLDSTSNAVNIIEQIVPQGTDTIYTSIADPLNEADLHYELFQNYPNPFNPQTTIVYRLAHSDFVTLAIYNLLGQKVATLLSKNQGPGNYKVEWNASGLSSGVFLYRLETEKGFVKTKKLILLK